MRLCAPTHQRDFSQGSCVALMPKLETSSCAIDLDLPHHTHINPQDVRQLRQKSCKELFSGLDGS